MPSFQELRECDDNALLRLFDIARQAIRTGWTQAERQRAEVFLRRTGAELRRRKLRLMQGQELTVGA